MKQHIFCAIFLTVAACGKDDSSGEGTKFKFEDQCKENAEFMYNTKNEPEADRETIYTQLTAYSSAVAATERNKSETGAFSVKVTWSGMMLSVKDATANTMTVEFFDSAGNPATEVVFNKEENPTLIMMDMKMAKVSHSNYLCRMQTDATYTIAGNKLTVTNVNFSMGSKKEEGSLWFLHDLKAKVNGTTDLVKRLDIEPEVKM